MSVCQNNKLRGNCMHECPGETVLSSAATCEVISAGMTFDHIKRFSTDKADCLLAGVSTRVVV